ncbi:MAG: DUF1993 domain-containing protein [Pseudomonadales bacterium]|nr:DUF1993 domain-containing protein [Pseudomonadales bacterium]
MLAGIIKHFDSRLNTLSQLLDQAASHFGNDDCLNLRLIDDMATLATQINFTCAQPQKLVQWLSGKDISGQDAEVVTSLAAAQDLISQTRKELTDVDSNTTSIPANKHLEFGSTLYADLSGEDYINDFLIPNFYFHFVTAYDILRANGVQIGKASYMAHLMDRVKETGK